VDTDGITQGNLATKVVLTDNNPGDKDQDPNDSETFTINASAGETVQFIAVANDRTTVIQFAQFAWENEAGNDHCFDPLPFASNNWTGTVKGEEGDHENFSITFAVQGETGCFTLDPKVQIKQSGG